MKGILLITWANIKRRKVQTFLVAICIALAALMFSTLIGIGLGMERPFENLFANLKASHIVMEFDVDIHNPQEVKSWFEAQDEVEHVSIPRIQKYIRNNLIFKGEEFANSVQLREHQGNSMNHDNLDIIKGEEADFPGPGEIWIPNHWLNQNEIVIGDTISVPTNNGLFPLLVSGIVVDAHYANGLFNPSPAWIGPGGLAMMFPVNELSFITLGIRVKDLDSIDPVWARFNKEFTYQGFSTQYSLFKQIFQIVYQITGGLLFIFAIFGIIVTLIITSSVVNSAIKTDYKMIGMLKAQGFTNMNVITVYLLQFFLITVVAVPFGLMGGYFMTLLVFKSLITAIGTVNFDISLLLPSIATFFAFLIGILFITYRTALQAGKIQPVTAIRNGGPPQKSFAGSKFSLFTLRPRSNLVIFLGLRFLMSNKKRSIFMFIGLLFVVFVQLFYANGHNSLMEMDNNRPAWGFNDCDLSISETGGFQEEGEDFFRKDLEDDDDRVKSISKRGFYGATLPAQEGKAPEGIFGIIYDNDLEDVGLLTISGRHPVFEDEISLGVTSSMELGRGIGDTLNMFLEGQLVTYNIVGLYQSLNNLSKGFYMKHEGITELNPLFKLRNYQVKLKRGVDPAAYKKELEETYGSAYKIEMSRNDLGSLKGIIQGIMDVMTLISLMFIGVLFVTVFNDTVLSIREGQRNLGIFKAVGMTPRQLQLALMVKALIIAFFALLIGVPISLYIIPNALDQLTTASGLVQFPYLFNLNFTLLVIPLILAITIGSVWVASQRVLKIRPRILVRE
ncbi:MAG: putative ABC transport system permease protein [Saprospiraceae bacterium]|jgi:putative ABC transport system permease protein